MSHEGNALQKSLDGIDTLRRRVLLGGWLAVIMTLGVYARLAYFQRTSDDLGRILEASVTALTFLIAWATFAVILIVTRATKSILRAIELSSRRSA